jgi:hypothetical protein
MLGGALVCWSLKKQGIVALSSCEAKYVSTSFAACQAVWFEMLLEELMISDTVKVKPFVDNKSAIDLANHPVSHGRSKHIERRYHFLRDQVNRGKLELEYCKSKSQLADILTKPFKKARIDELKKLMGMECLERPYFHCINLAWRRYKYDFKKDHFLKYVSMKEGLKNRPDSISEDHFKKLLIYWKCSKVQVS